MGNTSTTSDMQIIPLLIAGSKEELKNILMRVKEESERDDLKLNIKQLYEKYLKKKIMASDSIQFSSVQSLSCVQLFVTP